MSKEIKGSRLIILGTNPESRPKLRFFEAILEYEGLKPESIEQVTSADKKAMKEYMTLTRGQCNPQLDCIMLVGDKLLMSPYAPIDWLVEKGYRRC